MANEDQASKEQAAAYARARVLLEKIIPCLDGYDDHDVLLALQLLLAKHGRAAEYTPEGLVRVLDMNLPQMYVVWGQAAKPIIHGGSA
jgi:hypothetical protein